MITNDILTSLVKTYKDVPNPKTGKELGNAFSILTQNIIKATKTAIPALKEKEAEEECGLICFKNIERFNPEKGKAFNYFTTIILCHLRQLYRKQKSYKELKEQFGKFLKGKKRATNS